MASFMLAYAMFLILTAQSVNLFSLYERYFGGRLSNEGELIVDALAQNVYKSA